MSEYRGVRDGGAPGGRGGYGVKESRGGAGKLLVGRVTVQGSVSVHRGGDYPQPDPEVTQAEDKFMKQANNINGVIAKLNLKTTEFPMRPGFGTRGRPVVVFANYFRVAAKNNVVLYRYHMDVAEIGKATKPSNRKVKRVVTLFLEANPFPDIATDFRSIIVSPVKLDDMPADFQIPFKSEGEDDAGDKPVMYSVSLMPIGTLDVSALVKYMKETDPAIAANVNKLDIIQALNTVFGHSVQSKTKDTTVSGNKHFSIDSNPANRRELGGGLVALRGYFKSVRPATNRLLLNANVCHAVFIQELRLDILMQKHGLEHKARLGRFLKSARITRLHLPEKKNRAGEVIPRVKTINNLATRKDGSGLYHPPKVATDGAGPKDVLFWMDQTAEPGATSMPSTDEPKGVLGPSNGGGYISVWDYFSQNYPNIKMNPNLPVVNVGNRANPNYLPAEACIIIAGQPSGKELSPDQSRVMIEFACRKPKVNADSIVGDGRILLSLDPPDNRTLANFGLSVDASLETVHARILPVPNIKYQGMKNMTPANGSWNMNNVKFTRGTNIKRWTFIYIKSSESKFNTHVSAEAAAPTVEKFRQFMNSSGVNMGSWIAYPPPCMVQLQGSVRGKMNEMVEAEPIDEDLARIGNMLMNMGKAQAEFVFIILPYYNTKLYGKIKTIADTQAGVNTVCVIGSKFFTEKRQEQFFANVALKFNLKAGGINQILEPVKLGLISEGRTMVVGIDVTHPSPDSKSGAPSIAGIVASIDKELGQWPAELKINPSRQEMVDQLEDMLMSRLVVWQKRNGQLPENILIYRDGVSEGQYQTVIEDELQLLRNACKSSYTLSDTAKGLPRISIVIVGKRHHTRFYPTGPTTADRSHNCKNGTVVDRGVTEMRTWDFFLQAHSCLQGTARPAHYVVILDEIFRARKSTNPQHKHAADTLEDLTHNMCHLFGRATKTVSICPAAFYADLVCERARYYMADLFNPSTASDSSAASTAGSSAKNEAQKSDVEVAHNLRDTMFYI